MRRKNIKTRNIIYQKTANKDNNTLTNKKGLKLYINVIENNETFLKNDTNGKNINKELNIVKKSINSKKKLEYVYNKNNKLIFRHALEKTNKNSNDSLEKFKNKEQELLTLENEGMSLIKRKSYLNYDRKLMKDVETFTKYKREKENNKTVENMLLDKNLKNSRKNANSQDYSFIINNFKIKKSNTKIYKYFKIQTHLKNTKSAFNDIDNIKLTKDIKINLTETDNNKNKFDYIKNKTNKPIIKIEQNKFEKEKNYLVGDEIKLKFFKKNVPELLNAFKLSKIISHKKSFSSKYNYNHSETQNSLRKYFSLAPKDIDEKNKSKQAINYKDKIKYNKNKNSLFLNQNSKLNKDFYRKIKIIKINRNNIFKFKKKLSSTNDINKNLIKPLSILNYYESKDAFNCKKQRNKKINCIDGKNNSRKGNHKKYITFSSKDFINNKKFSFSHISKNESLNLLHNLDDYIGPNQYEKIIIPNNKSKIMKKISERRKRVTNKKISIFKSEENKRNNEYYTKMKNLELTRGGEYYNSKDFDKLILSGEKNSKYFKMRKILYDSAFKKCKYEFTN